MRSKTGQHRQLTDVDCRKTKHSGGIYPDRLYDKHGLYLEVGRRVKTWYLKFKLDGKDERVKLGNYDPDDSQHTDLAKARALGQSARALVKRGLDPRAQQRLDNLVDTTRTVRSFAEEWFEAQKKDERWAHPDKVWAALENHALPDLGFVPVAQLEGKHLHAILRKRLSGYPDTLRKVHNWLVEVFDRAVFDNTIERNPLLPKLKGSLPSVDSNKRRPAIVDLCALGEILKRADACLQDQRVSRAVYHYHLLLAFTALRSGELEGACWGELNELDAVLTIPRQRMKEKHRPRDYRTPIPPALLKLMKAWRNGARAEHFMFPGALVDYTTQESVEKLYRDRLGLRGQHTPHSWRAAFKTLAEEEGKDNNAIEVQLDHLPHGGAKVQLAYDRGDRFVRRVELMNWWASQLMGVWQ